MKGALNGRPLVSAPLGRVRDRDTTIEALRTQRARLQARIAQLHSSRGGPVEGGLRGRSERQETPRSRRRRNGRNRRRPHPYAPAAASPMSPTASVPRPSSRSRSRPTSAGSSVRATAGAATTHPHPWRRSHPRRRGCSPGRPSGSVKRNKAVAKLQRKSISLRTVEALSVEKDMMYWDSELPGFGVRVYPSGSKVYIAQTRVKGRSETGHGGPSRRDHGGAGAAACGADHHPRESGRGSDTGAKGPGTGADGGRGRHPLSGGARRGAVQAGDRSTALARGAQARPTRPWHALSCCRDPRAGRRLPPRALQHAVDGKRGGFHPVPPVLLRRRLRPSTGGKEPLPLRGQVQRARASAS